MQPSQGTTLRHSEKGATLVEYAVVAPLLFLLLFGIVEFARVTASFTSVWTAAREGARYATMMGDSSITPGLPRYLDCAGIRQTSQELAIFHRPSSSDVTVSYFDPAGAQVADCNDADATYPAPSGSLVVDGSTVSVSVHGTFDPVVPMIATFLDGVSLDSTQSRSIFKGVLGA